MSLLKKILIALGVLVAVMVIAFAEFNLPSTAKVRVTGTDVKRLDTGKNTADGQAVTRDVRFIYAKDKESGRDFVFRNEDTGWGWPPYFKFDSGSLAAKVTNIKETQPDATVLITYYGWRITFLDMYPNAVRARVVADDYSHFPVFNVVLIVSVLVAIGFIVIRIRMRRSD